MTDRADVHVGLGSLELFLGHIVAPPKNDGLWFAVDHVLAKKNGADDGI